jgi:predicted alpha/beta superfamily hydrolase
MSAISEQTNLKIELHTINHDDRPVFLAGNFNNWTENHSQYQMTKIGDGHYDYTFDDVAHLPEQLEYKYTRGNWQNAESDTYGNKSQNRLIYKSQALVTDYVPRWFNNGKSYNPELLPSIETVHEAFEIPQLNKTRKVRILLPHDYHSTSRRYPVLYLQDAQNLFDPHAPFGNWAVNEKLAVLKEYGRGDLIVVAIDHGETSRINEFTPKTDINLGIGHKEGTKYLDFMANTLKPYIDEHYRTLTQKEFTGIGGSSMGGLISLFGGVLHPEIFGLVMVFSPSLWIYPDAYEETKGENALKGTKLYIYAGGRESQTMLPNVHKLLQSIHERGNTSNINLVVDPNGTHNELRWSMEFPEAVEWLYF